MRFAAATTALPRNATPATAPAAVWDRHGWLAWIAGFVTMSAQASTPVLGATAVLIFLEAGFEWREPGCSMCLAMNPDRLESGEHCASTSNRNFEGRQGAGGRTHLVSPAMAAAAAVAGHFIDVRELIQGSAA